MTRSGTTSWKTVRGEVLRRIAERVWRPGEHIPNEMDLAVEFQCARATVNRALRDLAEDGLLERRRKGGTRVALNPVRRAVFDIPITRLEVEGGGGSYGHRLISRKLETAPKPVSAVMRVEGPDPMLHVRALHLSDDQPFMSEDRWINLSVVPDARDETFGNLNANEWLIRHASYTSGDIEFTAVSADRGEADLLQTDVGAALFVIRRTTWNGPQSVTHARLTYAPGYAVRTTL